MIHHVIHISWCNVVVKARGWAHHTLTTLSCHPFSGLTCGHTSVSMALGLGTEALTTMLLLGTQMTNMPVVECWDSTRLQLGLIFDVTKHTARTAKEWMLLARYARLRIFENPDSLQRKWGEALKYIYIHLSHMMTSLFWTEQYIQWTEMGGSVGGRRKRSYLCLTECETLM